MKTKTYTKKDIAINFSKKQNISMKVTNTCRRFF